MIVLASKSPRRQQLMHRITDDFIVDVSDIDESKSLNLPPLEAVLDIAKRKGLDVAKRHPDQLVISADTIVVIDNLILGKPIDEADASRILNLLSNKTHKVITAYCLLQDEEILEDYVISEVTFNKLEQSLIDEYIASGSPMDKAGAYGAQDNQDFLIIKNISGSRDNVIGFPVDEIKASLEKFKKIGLSLITEALK